MHATVCSPKIRSAPINACCRLRKRGSGSALMSSSLCKACAQRMPQPRNTGSTGGPPPTSAHAATATTKCNRPSYSRLHQVVNPRDLQHAQTQPMHVLLPVARRFNALTHAPCLVSHKWDNILEQAHSLLHQVVHPGDLRLQHKLVLRPRSYPRVLISETATYYN